MHRILTFGFFMLISLSSQGQYLKMATFAAFGGTVTSGRNYMSQVIGQSSVMTGTATSQGTTLRQGFKQPLGFQQIITRISALEIHQEENPWSFETFPNPFWDQITLRFNRPTSHPVSLHLHDSQGNLVWQSDYPDQMAEIKLEQFQHIKASKYVLTVFQKEIAKSQSIIKQSN